MKSSYKKGGISTAAYHMVSTLPEARKFIKEVGYPVVVKPDNGVGASNTYRIRNDEELENFLQKCSCCSLYNGRVCFRRSCFL